MVKASKTKISMLNNSPLSLLWTKYYSDLNSDSSPSLSSSTLATKHSYTLQRVQKRRKMKRNKATKKSNNQILTIMSNKCNSIINTYEHYTKQYCISKYNLIVNLNDPV